MSDKIPEINSVQAIGIAGVTTNVPAKELHIGFNLADQTTLVVKLPAGAVGGLILGARSEYQKIAHSEHERQFVGQPLVVQSARAFSFQDGRAGIILDVETFEFPLLLSGEDIANLRASLLEVEEFAKNPIKPKLQQIFCVSFRENRTSLNRTQITAF